jgi:PKD repeat protein
MKKNLLGAIACLSILGTTSYAQTIIPCGTNEAIDYCIKNVPGYKAQMEAKTQAIEQEIQAKLTGMAAKTSTLPASYTFTIPTVFHILHLGEAIGTGSNISDAACIAALAQVNRDYARKNADTTSIDPLYEPLYVNSRIQLQLAKKDPQGNCTSGIIHHYNPNTNWKQNDIYNFEYSTVGTYNWNSSKYLNIYIVKNIISGNPNQQGIIVGYTYKPGTAPNTGADAIVYRNDFLSGTNARSLSHELGHWLGLGHTFGDGNEAGSGCGNDDISDTPATSGFFSTCPLPYTALNDSCDPGNRPNINNIMDYSGCPLMFTQGQTTKMRTICESSVANRKNLSDTLNLIATGILNNTVTVCAPIADFYANKVFSCSGQNVTYNNTSYNSTAVTNYTWTFEGGTPATSNLASPSVLYSNPGVYGTTLTVSNANGTSTVSKEDFVTVRWNSDINSYPHTESFESGVLPNHWSIYNLDYNSIGWQYCNYGSQGTGKSMLLPNANGGYWFDNIDILETPQFNFHNTNNISVSFDYSYARRPGTTGEVFKFQYTTDCGGTWADMPGTPSTTVMAASGGTMTAPYVPFTANKWVTKTYLPASLGALNNKRDVKFRFYFNNDPMTGSAQNLYIDQFSISATVGLEEFANEIGLAIYPNPTNSSSTIEFTSQADSKVNVSVYDVTGRKVEESSLNASAGQLTKHEVNKADNLSAGVYFVTLTMNNQKVTKKLIIE